MRKEGIPLKSFFLVGLNDVRYQKFLLLFNVTLVFSAVCIHFQHRNLG